MFKRHLTLIIKVDNLLRATLAARLPGGEIVRNFNILPCNRREKPAAAFFSIGLEKFPQAVRRR
jgi:hypothetical protein